MGVLLCHSLQASIQVLPDLCGVLDEVPALDFLDDGSEKDRARRVAHPGVELAVGFVGAEAGVAEVVAGGLGFFGKGDHVRGVCHVPVLVGPELAGGADAGLDLVNDEEDVVAFRDVAQAAEEGGRSVVVTTFGLDWLDDDGADGVVEVFDQVFGLSEAAGFLGHVFLGEFVEGVFEVGEGGLRPVKCGDVEFVNWFAAGGGEAAEETAVESGAEGHD